MTIKPPLTGLDKWLTGFVGEEFGLIHKLYEWYKLLHMDVSRYPKTERYAIGEKLKNNTLYIIESVWEANNLSLPERIILLDKTQRKLDLMKIFIRLIHDLGIYKLQGYTYRQERLQKIGKMLGSWRKNTRKKLGLDP